MEQGALKLREHAWGGSRLGGRVARPMVRFLRIEAASGVMLVAATAVALVWVNSPVGHTYHAFWEAEITLGLGGLLTLSEPLEAWVKDGLMVVFFFVVGLEIKSELVVGDLRQPRVAALPAVAAVGGMVVPALIFLALNTGTEAARGWAIPMATDIAFAMGVLTLLGRRAPSRLKLFLLTLAIADDLGAILVIAIFYTADLSLRWLGLSVALLVLVAVMQRFRVWYTPLYVVVGALTWLAMHQSGVHPTIAGVALGLLAPARPLLGPRAMATVRDILTGDAGKGFSPGQVRDAAWYARESVSVTSRMTTLLSPWTSFVIVPLFALSSAGIELSADRLGDALGSNLTWGVVLGLVVGKPLGITLFTWLAARSPWAELPPGLTMGHIVGGGAVAGIGFTVSLFVTRLAFTDPAMIEVAVIGILSASLLSAVIGSVLLSRVGPPAADQVDPALDHMLAGRR
jgi:NhaA family Na+:H+ antiporter